MRKITFKFEPSKEIREFDCTKLIGKIATIELCHLSDDKKDQYVQIRYPLFDISIGDWVPTLGKEKEIIKRKIKNAYLMEATNGGRRDKKHYNSYKDYFDNSKKEEVKEYWIGGLIARMSRGGGDLDRCDIVIEFESFKVEGHIWDMIAPEEWYSELHRDKFKFEKGFYKDADEAIHFFSDRSHDDLFGERYFPVIVFPKDTIADVRSIANCAKSCSKPIMTNKHIIFGLRCKPHEYESIIKDTYEKSGQIARSKEWDWE